MTCQLGKDMAAKKRSVQKSTVDADSRARLIDAALRAILKNGVDAVRIDDIVAEVGVTKGSLYWHFEDRNALIKAALAEHIQRLNEDTIAGVSDAITKFDDKEAYLQRVAPYFADPYNSDQVRERWNRLALFVETRNHPELLGMMRDVQARNLEVFVELMTEAQNTGVLRQDVDARAVAVALNAMYLGSNIIDVLGEHAPTPEAWWGLISFFVGALFPEDDTLTTEAEKG
jgi:AcrR family transcriptional regulator